MTAFVAGDFAGSLAHHLRRDLAFAACVGAQQRTIGDDVDQPRNAACGAMQCFQGRRGEQCVFRACHLQTVFDVGRGIGRRQCFEVVTRSDALRQLAQVGARQLLGELRLTDQNNPQQLALVGFEVRQQTQLLEYICGEVLGFVDEQNRGTTTRVAGQQMGIDAVDELFGATACSGRIDAQLIADGLEQLYGVEARVQDERDVDHRRHLGEQAATERCFAGTHFAGEHHKAAGIVQSVHQVRECLAMALRQKQEPRVGRNRERTVREGEERLVHGVFGGALLLQTGSATELLCLP